MPSAERTGDQIKNTEKKCSILNKHRVKWNTDLLVPPGKFIVYFRDKQRI